MTIIIEKNSVQDDQRCANSESDLEGLYGCRVEFIFGIIIPRTHLRLARLHGEAES
jgi:hypothetical protein